MSNEGNRRFFPNGSYTILLLSEFLLTIPNEPWRKQKIFPQWIIYHPTPQQVFPYHPKRAMKEVEDSSPMSTIHQKIPSKETKVSPSKSSVNHIRSKIFFPNGSHIYTTPQWVHPFYSSANFSSPNKSWEAEDSSSSTPQRVLHHP